MGEINASEGERKEDVFGKAKTEKKVGEDGGGDALFRPYRRVSVRVQSRLGYERGARGRGAGRRNELRGVQVPNMRGWDSRQIVRGDRAGNATKFGKRLEKGRHHEEKCTLPKDKELWLTQYPEREGRVLGRNKEKDKDAYPNQDATAEKGEVV